MMFKSKFFLAGALTFLAMFCFSASGFAQEGAPKEVAAADTAAADASKATRKHDWRAKSVNGKKVNTKHYRGQVLMVFLNSPESRDLMKPLTKEMVLKYGHNPNVAQLTVVDLRELDFYKRPFAEDHIAKAQKRTVKRIQKIMRDNNQAPIPGLGRRLHLFADFDGKICKKYKHWNTEKHVTVAVVNKQGDLVGSWKSTQTDKIFEAVDALLAE